MNITRTETADTCRIAVAGALALDTVQRFLDGAAVPKGEQRQVLLDCTGLTFMDSTGANGLLAAVRRYHDDGIRFEIINLLPEVKEMLDVLGFFAVLPKQS